MPIEPSSVASLNRPVDLLVIIIYMGVLLAMGFLLRRFSSDTSDYFRAGCRAKWWLAGASIFLAQLSAWTFTGAAGVAFEAGWSIMLVYVGGVAAMFLQFLFLARWFRQLRAITVPEVLRERFGPATQQFFAFVQIFSTMLLGAVALYGVSIFISSIFNMSIGLMICLLGLVVLVYSTAGGNWAVMATDFLQGVVIFAIATILAITAIYACGGLDGFFEAIRTQGLQQDFRLFKDPGEYARDKYTIGWAVALAALIFVNAFSMINAVRYFAVKDGKEASMAALFACGLTLFGLFIWFIPPMVARILFPEAVMANQLTRPVEGAYAVASVKLLPPGMTGLMAVAMISATMSSMDTALNRNAAVLVRDVIPAILLRMGRPLPPEPRLLRLGQGLTVVLGLVVILLALSMALNSELGIFDIMQTFTALIGVPVAVPLALAVFVKRTPPEAALVSICCGFAASLVAYFSEALFGVAWNFQVATAVNIGVGTIAFFLACLRGYGKSQEYRDRVNGFFEKMHRPVNFNEEVGEANDDAQLRLVGRFTLGVGVASMLLLPLVRRIEEAFSVVAFSVLVGGIGLLMVLMARRGKK